MLISGVLYKVLLSLFFMSPSKTFWPSCKNNSEVQEVINLEYLNYIETQAKPQKLHSLRVWKWEETVIM